MRVKDVPVLVDGISIHPHKPLQGFSLINVTGTAAKGVTLANVSSAKLRDIKVTGFAGSLVSINNVTGEGLKGAATIDPPSCLSRLSKSLAKRWVSTGSGSDRVTLRNKVPRLTRSLPLPVLTSKWQSHSANYGQRCPRSRVKKGAAPCEAAPSLFAAIRRATLIERLIPGIRYLEFQSSGELNHARRRAHR